ncbi:unnamed protein product [Arctia plantaginis]|uniref:Uncharacterized protein n=1 Tax=Arctia plantaginis TaxID=874455 RepID=A0A8S0ZJK1_ARCPL|nr:unnamed protein product [Arctia plantaginis]
MCDSAYHPREGHRSEFDREAAMFATVDDDSSRHATASDLSRCRETGLRWARVRAVRLRRDAARPRLETAPTATPHVRERSAPLSNMLG